MKLLNRVALITGSGKGLGREMAKTLAREGADIVLNDVDVESLADTEKEILALGRKCIT